MGSSVKALRAANLLVPSCPSFQLHRPPATALQRRLKISCESQPFFFFLALCRIFCSWLLFINQRQGRWLWFFREIDVYLTWCYQSSSVLLKNEKNEVASRPPFLEGVRHGCVSLALHFFQCTTCNKLSKTGAFWLCLPHLALWGVSFQLRPRFLPSPPNLLLIKWQ